MKKYIAILLCAAMILCLCACGKTEPTPPDPEETPAPTEELVEETPAPDTEPVEANGILRRVITYNPNGLRCDTTEYEYDEVGRVAKESFFGVNDAPTGYNSYEYGESGSVTLISYQAAGPEEFVEDYRMLTEYQNGSKLKETSYYGDEIAAVTVYAYDDTGYLLSEKYYEGESELIAEYDYSYDDAGRVGSVLRHDYMEGATVKNVYTYNADELVTVDICYDEQDKVVSRTEYSYDSRGSETRCSLYDAGNALICATDNTYTYDEHGNIIKCVRTYSDGSQGSVIEYWWDYSKG